MESCYFFIIWSVIKVHFPIHMLRTNNTHYELWKIGSSHMCGWDKKITQQLKTSKHGSREMIRRDTSLCLLALSCRARRFYWYTSLHLLLWFLAARRFNLENSNIVNNFELTMKTELMKARGHGWGTYRLVQAAHIKSNGWGRIWTDSVFKHQAHSARI